jgi:hypothetical protein
LRSERQTLARAITMAAYTGQRGKKTLTL